MPPPPPRAIEALEAMKNHGFSKNKAVPVLKKLLKVCDQNWEYIEENGYQVLIDSILENRELKATSGKTQDAADGNEPEHSTKRLRKVAETDPSSSMIAEALLKKPKLEPDISPEASIAVRGAEPVSPRTDNRGKTTHTMSSQPSPSSERAEHDLSPLNHRETRASARARKSPTDDGSGSEVQKNTMTTSTSFRDGEADDNLPEFAVPIAMILPPNNPVPPRIEESLKVMLLSGSDLLESFCIPGVWMPDQVRTICRDFGVICIRREGKDIEKIVANNELLAAYKSNIISVDEIVPNQISSTKLRECIRRGLSVKYLTSEEVIDYIRQHKLYMQPNGNRCSIGDK